MESPWNPGRFRFRSGPDPDQAGPEAGRLEEFAYDAMGRTVGTQVNATG